MVEAHVEEALDSINATPDQRQKVAAMQDKLLADSKQNKDARRGLMTTLADQFALDQMDTSALDQAIEPTVQAHHSCAPTCAKRWVNCTTCSPRISGRSWSRG